LWADRFDGDLIDIFDLQDQLVTRVVGAIAPQLEKAEIERAKRELTGDPAAYDFYLRGLASWNRWSKADNAEALKLFHAARRFPASISAACADCAAPKITINGIRAFIGFSWPGSQDALPGTRLVLLKAVAIPRHAMAVRAAVIRCPVAFELTARAISRCRRIR
jgi:hypothetical protein